MKEMENLVKCAIFTGHQGTEIYRNTSTIEVDLALYQKICFWFIEILFSWLMISKRILEGVIVVVVKTQTVLQNIPQPVR